MSNEIIYVLLPDYAAHEAVYLSQAIASDEFALKESPKYVNKVVAPTLEPVKSIGSFRTLPDYSFETMPDDYAAVVLIGGFGWSTPVAEQVVPIVRQAIGKGKIVGAICNGASFLAKHGFLNAVRHTGNGLEQLKLWGGDNYTYPDGYTHAQAVSDKNIVTANGSATLESPHINDYIYPKIHTLTEESKSISEVQAEAQKLLDEGCDIPSINIKVDFVALEKTVEYREYAVLEEVFLGDMVTVINTKMGFQKQAKVISYEWNCLLEQYNEVELGDFIPTLAASVTSGVKSGSLASSAYINAASVMTLLQQHLNDFENPHHVTAAQVQS